MEFIALEVATHKPTHVCILGKQSLEASYALAIGWYMAGLKLFLEYQRFDHPYIGSYNLKLLTK